MKPIKFKGKRLDNGGWVCGGYFYDENRSYIITNIKDTDCAYFGHKSNDVELYVVDPKSICDCDFEEDNAEYCDNCNEPITPGDTHYHGLCDTCVIDEEDGE